MSKARRSQQQEHGSVCAATSREHADAVKLVEYLIEQTCRVEASQEVLARKLNLMTHKNGLLVTDVHRFHRARQHLMERIDSTGEPCCGFRLHYRKSGPTSELVLVDPSGDLGHHVRSALAAIDGYISRKRQHTTEDRRMTETFRAVADHAMSQGDLDGARLMLTASIDVERVGSVTPQTMADVEMWLAT